ncbi:hypothetical protein EN943_01805 [Mesorhizobium sp. M7A.F.Ca.US.006.01.1.1]|uniref:glycosyl hydrolase family 79 C-terminal domain-containing protein n=1 Tax=Mesorhizobium sp. M7A.F.Ca.US.006.01.1.1 TaxID=2496707 RepID=UPI000FCB71EF|nr:glycosyl hydrolase family 79 C-terminal domain-containing protein [Mesorhizobium sp. M7A.F.Ca.US.006.01.1.1]RUZ81000.1 hypothetical protein EN943_01805 [Mesorhizobium sp. M7A.F.Ca.US.006.01.1.1]
MTARILMVALDGADGSLVDRLSQNGLLPNLTSLRARGRVKYLTAHAGATDDTLWASFQYAAGMGEHGRYHYLQRLRSGRFGMICTDEVDRETFWETAPSLRIGVFDIPKCRLPRQLNGIHLADWLVHGRYFQEPKSYPAALAGEVVARFGAAPPSQCDHDGPLDDAEAADVLANLRVAVAKKRAAALHYLGSDAWDLFIVGFKEAHCAGHSLWDLVNEVDPEFDPSRNERLGTPIETILGDIDGAIGDLAAAAGSGTQIIVFSTTAMQPNASLAHLMPEVVNRANRILGESRWTRFVRHVVKLEDRRWWPLCEMLPYNENCTAFRINPAVAFKDGQVDAERSRILDLVETLLMELRDDQTGQPVVAMIDRAASQHAGSRAADLPDLLVHYRAGLCPGSVSSLRLGRIEAIPPILRPGNHAPGGFLIVSGDRLDVSDVTGMQNLGTMAINVLHGSGDWPADSAV